MGVPVILVHGQKDKNVKSVPALQERQTVRGDGMFKINLRAKV